MARVELAPEVLDDLERILDHLAEHGSTDAPQRIARIVEALDILQAHPLIGRPASSGQRELVIGQGRRGYVARYCFVADIDTVFVLAVRSQREAGFRR
jgi:plasmid stabilization system protein ParE